MVGGVLMMRRKILFWANAGFTSDVTSHVRLPKLQNVFVINVTHFN